MRETDQGDGHVDDGDDQGDGHDKDGHVDDGDRDDQGDGHDKDDDVDDGFIQTCQLRVSSSMCSLLKTSRESVQYWQIESDDEFAKY